MQDNVIVKSKFILDYIKDYDPKCYLLNLKVKLADIVELDVRFSLN